MEFNNAIHAAQAFNDKFKVEGIIGAYNDWAINELPILNKDLENTLIKLQSGGLKQIQRKKLNIARNTLRERMIVDDPRRMENGELADWLNEIEFTTKDMSKPEISKRRSEFKSLVNKAVNDCDAFDSSGLPSFCLDSSGTKTHFWIKTLTDALDDKIQNYSTKRITALTREKGELRKAIALVEHHESMPENLRNRISLHLNFGLKFGEQISLAMDTLMKNEVKEVVNLHQVAQQVAQKVLPDTEKVG